MVFSESTGKPQLMHTVRFISICFTVILLGLSLNVLSQTTTIIDSTDPYYRTVIAGQQYKAKGIKQTIWGKHYRKEWTTPVKVPVMLIDTAKEIGRASCRDREQ